MPNKEPNDLITVAEARKMLGVSTVKIAQLIKNGMLHHSPDPLDKRVKLVSEAEVRALQLRSRKAAA